MKRILATTAICSAALLGSSPASAQQVEHEGWFLRGGLVGVYFDPGADVSVAGGQVPGTDITIDDNYSLTVDIGYRFNENWSATFSLGLPPEAEIEGSGTLSGYRLGNVTYGPAVLMGQYRFPTNNPKFMPYVGAGINYTIVFDTDDKDVIDFEVDDNWGAALQVGFESMITDRMGLYFDVNKIWIDTDASGSLGGAPADVKVTLDPLLVRTGVVWRF
ncbi:OmpW/AlkL family protein [Celeribacter indicus]|uniref:OmpW family protein n=1 Tax=Celeribacter indicus TaxID=1208324 RepID=A0A0B5DV32_9RHOB|nr:OmpW family outer membrane protein [Celeribacter indicus]AJE45070.1 OmpW family protein [Celeribacter indicus]SDX42582.1 outer membrane protein [Celeribacter indicus]